jgi:hypothetical protein
MCDSCHASLLVASSDLRVLGARRPILARTAPGRAGLEVAAHFGSVGNHGRVLGIGLAVAAVEPGGVVDSAAAAPRLGSAALMAFGIRYAPQPSNAHFDEMNRFALRARNRLRGYAEDGGRFRCGFP